MQTYLRHHHRQGSVGMTAAATAADVSGEPQRSATFFCHTLSCLSDLFEFDRGTDL
jgi:hypothetical protein